jgi:4-hydroxy-tetrahydrodipicolinate synthase
MDGVISVAANCFPKDFCRMVNFALAGDFARARPLHYGLLEGADLLFAENNPAGVKAFLAEMGIIKNHLRLPLVPLSPGIHQQVKDFIKQIQ